MGGPIQVWQSAKWGRNVRFTRIHCKGRGQVGIISSMGLCVCATILPVQLAGHFIAGL